jgi:hypothetical protein
VIERCSPQSVPFPPQPPPKAAALRCSAGSLVLRHSPTSPVRSCPQCGLWPSRTGLDLSIKTCRRSPGSRACCFSACAGSETTQDRTIHSRLAWLSCCLPPLGMESASCSIGFSKLNSPAHRYLCLRFKRHLAISPARLEARMDSLFSFPVGLFHPLQHAGLSRRSPSSRRSGSNRGLAHLEMSMAVNSLDSPLTARFRGKLPASTEIHHTQSCDCRDANPVSRVIGICCRILYCDA